jgi:hypothetical protein
MKYTHCCRACWLGWSSLRPRPRRFWRFKATLHRLLSLTADDLAKMPRETVSVPAPDGTKIVYEGVTLLEVLQKAGAPLGKQLRGKALASYVLAKAHGRLPGDFHAGRIGPPVRQRIHPGG